MFKSIAIEGSSSAENLAGVRYLVTYLEPTGNRREPFRVPPPYEYSYGSGDVNKDHAIAIRVAVLFNEKWHLFKSGNGLYISGTLALKVAKDTGDLEIKSRELRHISSARGPEKSILMPEIEFSNFEYRDYSKQSSPINAPQITPTGSGYSVKLYDMGIQPGGYRLWAYPHESITHPAENDVWKVYLHAGNNPDHDFEYIHPFEGEYLTSLTLETVCINADGSDCFSGALPCGPGQCVPPSQWVTRLASAYTKTE